MPRPWAAETAIGSPKPSRCASAASGMSTAASILFAATTTGIFVRRSRSASSSSPGRTPAFASKTNSATWASLSAARAWSRIEPETGSGSSESMPPVSMSVKRRPFHSVAISLRSRVIPGRSCTTASRLLVRRLTSEDLPTLGYPTTATFIGRIAGRGC